MVMEVSPQARPRFVLGSQGLWPGRRFPGGPAGIREAIRQAGLIQVDPLNVVARSHDLALHARVVDYRPEDLDRLMYVDRQAFDYGGTVYVLPMEELPYWRVPMARRRNDARWAAFAQQQGDLLTAVRRELRRRGPLGAMTTRHQLFEANRRICSRTFAWDDSAPASRRSASAARKLRDEGDEVARHRVRQPYRDADDNEGDDLLEELARQFESSREWARPIILVTAPAGYGKTVLFQALFSRLHKHFHEAKRRGEKARRPLPLLPDHLGAAGAAGLPGLIDEFLRTDVAGPMTRAAFEWMLTNGYGAWLIDGLDEVIARDAHFFEYLEDLILSADKVVMPRVLLCVRDSLLSTSESLRSLVNEVDGLVTRYELQPWKRRSIETYARMRLTKEHDWRMMAWVDTRPQVLRLCGTPYYAKLVADRVEADRSAGLVDIPESDLVRDAIRAILEREYTKDLRAHQISIDDLYYLIRDAALLQLQGGSLGIDVKQFAEEVEVLVSDRDPEERAEIVPQVLKLSVFRAAGTRGRIWFTHDAIHEYLVAEQALDHFGTNPRRLVELLNYGEFAADSIALRLIADHIDTRNAGDELIPLLYRARTGEMPTALRNLVSVMIRLRDASALLAQAPLTETDLSGLTFANLTLAGVDLTGANLQSVTFDRCDLTGLTLVDATSDETRFLHCQATLHAADYGSLRGLLSVIVDGRRVETPAAFRQMLRRTGLKAGATVDPCQTALRLRSLLKAMVGPNGRPRRKLRTSLVKGGATSGSAEILEYAIRAGLVTQVPGRASYECVRGPLYQGIVAYVRNLETSPEIKALLDEVCPIKGCTHIGL